MRGKPKPIITGARDCATDRNAKYRKEPHNDIKASKETAQWPEQAEELAEGATGKEYMIRSYR